MFSTTTSMALVASLAILPHLSIQKELRFCKDGTCPQDDCPVVTSDFGSGYPICSVFNTDDFLAGAEYPAAEGG